MRKLSFALAVHARYPRLSPSSYKDKPAAFQPFTDAVLEADGLYVVVPEYNGSFPGVLKLFIDMLPFPESFEARPVAFAGIAAGKFGNLRGVEQLQSVFGYRNAHIYPSRVFVSGSYSALTENGDLIDERMSERLDEQVSGYIQFIRQLKSSEAS